jgi:hypothetical protein
MAHFPEVILIKDRMRVCMPVIPIQAFSLFGVLLGLFVSKHASIELIARDYVSAILLSLFLGLTYNLYVMRQIYAVCEDLVAYNKQMDEVFPGRRQRASSLDLYRKKN